MQYYLHIISRVIHVLQALFFSGSLFSISCMISFCQPYKVCIVFFYYSIYCIYFVIYFMIHYVLFLTNCKTNFI